MIDPLRHLSEFTPLAFGRKRVDVIGCGATGSRIASELARYGVENLHVWDFDTIEGHNLANQMYDETHVGRPKVEALSDVVFRATGTRITPHCERVDGTQDLGEVVFLLPDTMEARKSIWEGAIRLKFRTRFMVETRMGVDTGRVYALNPNDPSKVRGWEKTLTDDRETAVSACGGSISIGATADLIAGFAMWQFTRWFQIVEMGKDDSLEDELVFSVRPLKVLTRNFELV